MTAVVIDDEHLSRRAVTNMLNDVKDTVQLIGEANSVKSGIVLIEKLKPNIVFLDIEMADGTGFDLLKKVTDKNFHVVFTTAHDGYAIQAFQFSAINYLLKPIARADLYFAIKQASEKQQLTEVAQKQHINTLIDNYENNAFKTQNLVLPDKEGYIIKPLEEIVRLEGQSNYTKVIFKDKTHFLSSYSISYYEGFLEKRGFFRIFKSHLINLSHVVRYFNQDGGTIEMTDGSNLRISATKKEEFKSLFL